MTYKTLRDIISRVLTSAGYGLSDIDLDALDYKLVDESYDNLVIKFT